MKVDCKPLWKGATAIFLCLHAGFGFAQAAPDSCGSLKNSYGPFDYRTERNGRLEVVDKFHFAPEVEALTQGQSSYLGDDLSYVLRASPNHHRALMAIVKWGERTHSAQPPRLEYSIDCYFERALRFQPDDTVARLLYAQYLGKTGRTQQATGQLKIAIGRSEDDPLAQYNIGLIYFDLKEYDQALVQAHKVMAMGFPGGQLTAQLKRSGHWRDPMPAVAAASAPTSSRAADQ